MRMMNREHRERLGRIRDRAQSARMTLATERAVPRRAIAERPVRESGAWTDRPPARRLTQRSYADGQISMRRLGSFGFELPVRDLSPAGCMVELVEQVSTSDHVIARLPGLEPFGATVMWSDERCAGIRFNRPIHPAVFERLLERLR
jgi:hypothetical protein